MDIQNGTLKKIMGSRLIIGMTVMKFLQGRNFLVFSVSIFTSIKSSCRIKKFNSLFDITKRTHKSCTNELGCRSGYKVGLNFRKMNLK